MFKQSPQYRYFNAYTAWKKAKNPAFKAYWRDLMDHFHSQFEKRI